MYPRIIKMVCNCSMRDRLWHFSMPSPPPPAVEYLFCILYLYFVELRSRSIDYSLSLLIVCVCMRIWWIRGCATVSSRTGHCCPMPSYRATVVCIDLIIKSAKGDPDCLIACMQILCISSCVPRRRLIALSSIDIEASTTAPTADSACISSSVKH